MIKNILKLVFKFLLQRLFNYFGIILNDSGVSFMLDLLNEIFSEVISKKNPLIIVFGGFRRLLKWFVEPKLKINFNKNIQSDKSYQI